MFLLAMMNVSAQKALLHWDPRDSFHGIKKLQLVLQIKSLVTTSCMSTSSL